MSDDAADEPLATWLINDTRDGATWLDWHCEPPPEDTAYEVIREEYGGWRIGHPVREIYGVRATD
jgi:hypothetical protein